MTRNRATIYSNGIADFQRKFTVTNKKPTTIMLPVNQDHLGDVLASLSIMGDVKLESPPTFQPANVDDTSLSISSDHAYLSLVKQLVGCSVVITNIEKKKQSGTLAGIHWQQVAVRDEAVKEYYLVLHRNGSLERIPFSDVANIKFDDEFVQAEIKKALGARLRNIKPNSSFVEFTVSTESSSTDAIIQYTVPAAAWKITYRLILMEDHSVEFHGFAIVDNNTAEDWEDFSMAVVMGQPITFSTDVALSKLPSRSHVDIVQDSALGAVEPSMMVMAAAGGAMDDDEFDKEIRFAGSKLAKSSRRAAASAATDDAAISESGDFCIFEATVPVSIGSKRSAVIPLFQVQLGQSSSVLHYNFDNHEQRPYRSVRFKNTTQHALARGVCTVFEEATYAGSCIIPGCREGQEALLPHALETSVSVTCIRKPTKKRRTGVKISEGAALQSFHYLRQTDYQIQSGRKTDEAIVLDHNELLHNSTKQCQVVSVVDDQPQAAEEMDFSQLPSGVRIEFPLEPHQTTIIRVIETKVENSRVVLAGDEASEDLNCFWLANNVVESNTDITNETGVRRCLDLQRELDEVAEQQKHAKEEIDRLTARQDRLRKNIKAGEGKTRIDKWENELARAEDAIVQLEDERMPELVANKRRINEKLYLALRELNVEWMD